MNLIIHHQTAWKAACQKYNIEPIDAPSSWPVLISFIESAEASVYTCASVMTVEMAGKFLSSCSADRLEKMDYGTRTKIVNGMGITHGNTTPATSNPTKPIALHVFTGLEVLGLDENQGPGVEPVASIPGLEEIPMDPSKLDPEKNIADLGDPTEHVLDVERSV